MSGARSNCHLKPKYQIDGRYGFRTATWNPYTAQFMSLKNAVKFLLMVALSLSGTISGQERTESNSLGNHIRGELEFLASDALQGRGSGTRDELIAATYIASQLSEMGLKPGG